MSDQIKLNEMSVVDEKEGDIRTNWDPRNPTEVGIARQAFDKAIAGGFWAYKVNPEGKRGEHLTEFDPEAGLIILAPRMVGG